jgi:hypothetical protein
VIDNIYFCFVVIGNTDLTSCGYTLAALPSSTQSGGSNEGEGSSGSDGGLSGGQIAGIVVGSVLGGLLVS